MYDFSKNVYQLAPDSLSKSCILSRLDDRVATCQRLASRYGPHDVTGTIVCAIGGGQTAVGINAISLCILFCIGASGSGW